jgi:hypothetical protein
MEKRSSQLLNYCVRAIYLVAIMYSSSDIATITCVDSGTWNISKSNLFFLLKTRSFAIPKKVLRGEKKAISKSF